MTWNLWWRHGFDWKQREKAIIDTLERLDADVIALQEVWAEQGRDNQAQILANELGYEHVYGTAFTEEQFEQGNAILSRWPIERHDLLHLETEAGVEPRNALFAEIASPMGRIPFFTTHLSYEKSRGALRQKQVEQIVDFIEASSVGPVPAILAGDFNADPLSDEIRFLTGERPYPRPKKTVFQDAWIEAGDETTGFTFTPDNAHFEHTRHVRAGVMPWQRRRIDYVFVALPGSDPSITPVLITNCSIVRGTSVETEGSDHFAVVADLEPCYLID